MHICATYSRTNFDQILMEIFLHGAACARWRVRRVTEEELHLRALPLLLLASLNTHLFYLLFL